MLLPSSFHWALLLTGIKKVGNDYWVIMPLYFSAVVFAIPVVAGLYDQPYTYLPFWGWVRTYENMNAFLQITLIWWCIISLCVLGIFGWFAYINRNSADLKYVSRMNFMGYSIASVGGMVVQLFFPWVLGIDPFPIASTLMLSTVFVILGLNAYKIFNLSETLDTESITGIMQEVVFVVSPDRVLTYINPYGEQVTQVKNNGRKKVKEIFAHDRKAYAEFEKKVLISSFKKEIPCTYHFTMNDKNGKQVHWDVSTYPIFKPMSPLLKNVSPILKTVSPIFDDDGMVGMLVICRDISDRFFIGEARLVALRSQMNPHFIFNSLNSIQHYIHTYQTEAAENFLSTFSLLIRKTLENSGNSVIPLSDEIATIELYLKLEKARFGERLNYEIIIDPEIDVENTLVPPMLIQPYIENGIIHGLSAKESGGNILIHLKYSDDSIICVIEDNGIGRQRSLELKNRNAIKNKSFGMSITQKRLEILNQYLNIPVSVNVTSVMNELNEESGTHVEINVPVSERF
jgi:PAS domain-containing protein